MSPIVVITIGRACAERIRTRLVALVAGETAVACLATAARLSVPVLSARPLAR